MVQIRGEIVINRPVDEVFDFVADERNEPRYNPRMLTVEQISSGPIGLGARFTATIKTMGRTAEMVIECTAFERPRRLASTTRMSAMDMQGILTFDPIPEGTRMGWTWELTPHGALKLMTPLVAGMGQRQEETNWASLKQHLEWQAPAAPREE
jgi:uncharacterized protein YndB with AHSA1/START domain